MTRRAGDLDKSGLRPFVNQIEGRVHAMIDEATVHMHRDARRSISEPSPPPSAPGQPPHKLTGNLRRWLKFTVTKEDGAWVGRIGYEEGSPAPYAVDLERGKMSRKLAPRPFLRPALDRAKARVEGRLRRLGR